MCEEVGRYDPSGSCNLEQTWEGGQAARGGRTLPAGLAGGDRLPGPFLNGGGSRRHPRRCPHGVPGAARKSRKAERGAQLLRPASGSRRGNCGERASRRSPPTPQAAAQRGRGKCSGRDRAAACRGGSVGDATAPWREEDQRPRAQQGARPATGPRTAGAASREQITKVPVTGRIQFEAESTPTALFHFFPPSPARLLRLPSLHAVRPPPLPQ